MLMSTVMRLSVLRVEVMNLYWDFVLFCLGFFCVFIKC